MKVVRVTVVPLECFERQIRNKLEEELRQSGCLVEGYNSSLYRTFNELVDDKPGRPRDAVFVP